MAEFDDNDIDRFLLGELPLNSPLYAKILDNFIQHPDGVVASTLRRWSMEAVEQADQRLDSIWNNVMSIPDDALVAGSAEVGSSETGGALPALDVSDYWDLDDYELSVELSQYEEAEAVHRNSIHPLEPYRELLREFVSVHWNWPQKRSLPEFRDPQTTAQFLADAIRDARLPLPFPPALVATLLVKAGLDSWC